MNERSSWWTVALDREFGRKGREVTSGYFPVRGLDRGCPVSDQSKSCGDCWAAALTAAGSFA